MSVDDLAAGAFSAAAHAIIGQPLNQQAGTSNQSTRASMMSIGDASDAAKRDKIVGTLKINLKTGNKIIVKFGSVVFFLVQK